MTAPLTGEVPPRLQPLGRMPGLADYVQSVWERRRFAYASASGSLRAEHMNTALGNVWHLLNPVLLILVYYILFDVILDISRGLDNFLGFLTVGILSYQWSQKTITSGAKVMIQNEGLVRSLQFPRALLPLATVIKETMAFLPGVVLMLAVLVATDEPVTWSWTLVPLVIVLHVGFNTGATLLMARIGDRFHDAVNVLPFLFRLAFYGSGVIFAVDARFADIFENEWLVWLFILNPFYAMISVWRAVLMDSFVVQNLVWVLASATTWTVLLLIAGLIVFRNGEKDYGRG